MANIIVEIVPATGKTTNLTIDTSEKTVAAVLKAARVDMNGMNIAVNGEPSTAAQKVKDGAKITLTEKPKGS